MANDSFKVSLCDVECEDFGCFRQQFQDLERQRARMVLRPNDAVSAPWPLCLYAFADAFRPLRERASGVEAFIDFLSTMGLFDAQPHLLRVTCGDDALRFLLVKEPMDRFDHFSTGLTSCIVIFKSVLEECMTVSECLIYGEV